MRTRRGEQVEGRADETDGMDADDLNALGRQTAGGASGAGVTVRLGRRSAEGLLNRLRKKTLAGVAHENRRAEVKKPAGVLHQFQVVFVGLAEPDAGIEADPLERDARSDERVAAGRCQRKVEFLLGAGPHHRDRHAVTRPVAEQAAFEAQQMLLTQGEQLQAALAEIDALKAAKTGKAKA